MSKPSGCGCGCFSFIIGMVALFIVVALPSLITDNGLINQVMGSVFCGDSDAYINESYTTSARRGGGISWVLNAKCHRPNNRIEDITSTQELAGFGLFFGCIIVGFMAFLIIPTKVTPPAITAKLGGRENNTSLDDDGLSNKLNQLENAYEAGLISKEEYDDARKRLLQNL
jgi:hypothetical protein